MVKTNLAKNTILLSIGTLMTNILQFIMVPLFSHWLSPSEYGTFDLCITYVSLLIPVINLASGEAVFRYSLDANGEEVTAHVSNGLSIVIINSILFSTILIISGVILNYFIIVPFVFLLFGQLLNSFCQSFLRGIKKLNIYSIGNILTTIFICIFVTVFVWKLNTGLYGIIWGYAIGYISGVLFLFCISKFYKYFSLKAISKRGMKELILYSYPLIPNNICWWVINASDRMIINIFLGNASNGIYAIANKIPNACSSVFGMFNISWQESASEVINQKERNDYYNLIFNKTTEVLISLCIGVLSLNFVLYDYIFDVKYYSAFKYTPILISALIFSSLAQFYGGIMVSLKMPKANGATTLVGALSNLIVHLGLIHYIGLYAAAFSTLIANMIMCLVRKWKLRGVVSCKWQKKIYLYWFSFAYMFIMAYQNIHVVFRILNCTLALLLLLFTNRGFIISILKKIFVSLNDK